MLDVKKPPELAMVTVIADADDTSRVAITVMMFAPVGASALPSERTDVQVPDRLSETVTAVVFVLSKLTHSRCE